jgi:nickel superoxide dismutase
MRPQPGDSDGDQRVRREGAQRAAVRAPERVVALDPERSAGLDPHEALHHEALVRKAYDDQPTGLSRSSAGDQKLITVAQRRCHRRSVHEHPADDETHGDSVASYRHSSTPGGPMLRRLLSPRTVVSAHCDLPCGVYDPAQARIEAESVKAICEKYQGNEDPVFRTRALLIKEQRAELVKHHLWVLWTDYFKPPHFEKYPELHQLFNEATKLAGTAGAKGTVDPAEAQKLLDKIAEIDKIFWETKQG